MSHNSQGITAHDCLPVAIDTLSNEVEHFRRNRCCYNSCIALMYVLLMYQLSLTCSANSVSLTSYLTWSKHTESNCVKAKKHLGRIYAASLRCLFKSQHSIAHVWKHGSTLFGVCFPSMGPTPPKGYQSAWGSPKKLCSGCVARTTRIYFRVFNCLNCQQGDFISDCH